MRKAIKRLIEITAIYHPLRNWIIKRRQIKQIRAWENKGRHGPLPHGIKQRTIRNYANKYDLRIFVETGTYYGDMIESMKDIFDYIYSIEIDKNLYVKAKKRFKKAQHIEIINGDSGKELGDVINKIDQRALFWLDAHYSGGVTSQGEKNTPIFEELRHILSRQGKGNLILIDDVRCFGTNPAYPTLEELEDLIYSYTDDVEIIVQDGIIRIIPTK